MSRTLSCSASVQCPRFRGGAQVPSAGSGSLVFRIDPLAPAARTLREADVVMEIEGVPIADDGTVEFRNEERVEFSHIVRSKHIGAAPKPSLFNSKPLKTPCVARCPALRPCATAARARKPRTETYRAPLPHRETQAACCSLACAIYPHRHALTL